MLKKLKTLFHRVEPEPHRVIITENQIILESIGSYKYEIEKNHITEIFIRTNDRGPFFEDFFYILNVQDKQSYTIPQSFENSDALFTYIIGLPTANRIKMTAATRSTENSVFDIWRKESEFDG